MELGGRTILITRSPEQSSEFISSIERHGGHALLFPVIRIEDPESWHECDEAIRNYRRYSDLIFTSTNAVNRFFDRCQTLGVPPAACMGIEIHAVGVKTARAIETHGLPVADFPETFSSAQLGQRFKAKSLHGKRFLLPQGDIAKQDLAEALSGCGAVVDTVVVYRTLDAEHQNVTRLLDLLRDGAIDVVTFASPSAARSFFRVIPPDAVRSNPRRPRIAVIGPVTAEAVVGLGLVVDIAARESTVAGLVNAIAEFFET